MAKEKIKQQPGHCAKCGSNDLHYETIQVEGEEVFYPYTCTPCGHTGSEWYSLDYAKSE